jgi:hypothetical protein
MYSAEGVCAPSGRALAVVIAAAIRPSSRRDILLITRSPGDDIPALVAGTWKKPAESLQVF